MSQKKKELLLFLAVGAVIGAAVVALRWSMDVSIFHKLCDGLFVPGILLLGLGGLKYFRNQGAFDMMSYSVSYVFYVAFPAAKMKRPAEQQNEAFYEYKQRKQKERKSADGMVIAGAIFLALSVLMLIIYTIAEA